MTQDPIPTITNHRPNHQPKYRKTARRTIFLLHLITLSLALFPALFLPGPAGAAPLSSPGPHRHQQLPGTPELMRIIILSGQVTSGHQPVRGATVTLFRSRHHPGDPPMTLADPVVTDPQGRFSFHFFPPADPGLLYAMVKGGNAGVGISPRTVLLAPLFFGNGAVPQSPLVRTINERVASTAVATFLPFLFHHHLFGDPRTLANLFSQYRGEIDLSSGAFNTQGFSSTLSLASQNTLNGWANAVARCTEIPATCRELFRESVSGTTSPPPAETLTFLAGAGSEPDDNQSRILDRARQGPYRYHSLNVPKGPNLTLRVTVKRGEKPVPGARLTLCAINLLTNATTIVATGITHQNGSATVSFPQNPDTRYEIIAWGSLVHGKENPTLKLIALLPSTFEGQAVLVNSLTTIAAVSSLKQAFTGNTINPAPLSAIAFDHSWDLATALVDPSNGTITPAFSDPSGTLPFLGSLLDLCGKTGSRGCQKLFALLSTPRHPVTNTMEAALSMESHPQRHLPPILALLPSAPALTDFLLKVSPRKTSATLLPPCPSGNPSMAVDGHDALFLICPGQKTLTRLGWKTGHPEDLFSLASFPLSHPPGALSIDPQGQVWIAESHALETRLPSGAPRSLIPEALVSPRAMAQNPQTQTVWVAGKRQIALFDGRGQQLGSFSLSANSLASDEAGTLWASLTKEDLVLSFDPQGHLVGQFRRTAGISHPRALAVDAGGNVWIANNDPDSLTGLSSLGNPLNGSPLSGGGINHPEGLAIDGNNTVWITNTRSGSLTAFSEDGEALSGSGWRGATIRHPVAIAVDGSGNLWVANGNPKGAPAGPLTLVIGAASPQTVPLSLSPR